MTTVFILLGLLVALVWGVRGAIRWYNLDKVAKARASKTISRQENRTERLRIRREGRKRVFKAFFRRG